MPGSPFRFRWQVPQGGVALFLLRFGSTRARPFNLPLEVLAPVRLDEATYAEIDLPEKTRAELVRRLEVLDPTDAAALTRYLSKWGLLTGSPVGWFGGQIRCEHEYAECFEAPDAEPLAKMPRFPAEAVLVPYVRLASVRQQVRAFQGAVERYRKLARLRGRERLEEREHLRRLVLEQLARFAGSDRDPETFLPLIGSPLATAWQHLAESAAGGLVPRLCPRCKRAFTLTETDKRLDRPPRYCSPRCRLADWRGRKKTRKEGKAPERRGRT